jgi:hypothetical protein
MSGTLRLLLAQNASAILVDDVVAERAIRRIADYLTGLDESDDT